MSGKVLLLSGGLDSTALAAWMRPEICLFIDYGQRAARGEARACEAVCAALDLDLQMVTCDCSAIGAGTMSLQTVAASVSAERDWWPYRNQLLATIAASWASRRDNVSSILIGTVSEDGDRFADGRETFVRALDSLLRCQERSFTYRAPALNMTSRELIAMSRIRRSILAWTHSCYVAASACGRCIGCIRRREVLDPEDRT